jgi:ribosomal protein S13
VGVLTSVPVALVIKREEKNKRIWDLREKRHKGVKGQDTHTHVLRQ